MENLLKAAEGFEKTISAEEHFDENLFVEFIRFPYGIILLLAKLII